MTQGIKKIFATKLTEVATTDKEGVGTIRFEGNKVYKWVKLQNTTATVAVAAGDAVAYNAATGHSVNQVVSDLSDADAIPVCAGLVQAAIAGVLATAYYCWIQIKGPATALQTLAGSPADGDLLMMATSTDKTLTKQLFAGTTPNIAATGGYAGIATDASAKLVALDCPF